MPKPTVSFFYLCNQNFSDCRNINRFLTDRFVCVVLSALRVQR